MIDDLIREGDGWLQRLIQTAFDRGRAVGRAEESAAIKNRLASVFSDITSPEAAPKGPTAEAAVAENVRAEQLELTATEESVASSSGAERAPRGSNRPIVLNYLRSAHRGLRPATISEETGVKENSVRAMLNILRHEGLSRKEGDYWFAVRTGDETNETADAQSAQDTSTASDRNPEHGREAGQGGGT